MQSVGFYRFVQEGVERISVLEGQDSWYRISDGRNETVCFCHVIGSCLGGTSTFHTTREDAEVLFRIEPRRKLLNLTYDVCDGESGPPIATLRLFATRGMKVSDAGDRELFRVIDPQGKLDKLMQDLLEGCCGEYAIVDDDRVIGRFERRERPRDPAKVRKGVVGRVLGGLSRLLVRDWCVELEEDGKAIADHRALLAALIVLQEQSIRHDQSH